MGKVPLDVHSVPDVGSTKFSSVGSSRVLSVSATVWPRSTFCHVPLPVSGNAVDVWHELAETTPFLTLQAASDWLPDAHGKAAGAPFAGSRGMPQLLSPLRQVTVDWGMVSELVALPTTSEPPLPVDVNSCSNWVVVYRVPL